MGFDGDTECNTVFISPPQSPAGLTGFLRIPEDS
jgi:hypothetical protein